jgi:catalase-peroxidase
MDADFDYAAAYQTLDHAALKRDLTALMTDSQDWWPADWGHYGGCSSAWPGMRRHLPHGRRPRRRRQRQPALRAAEQLARQRQPRQGTAPAVADQAEVRQRAVLGRPDDPGRQRRAGVAWASRPSAFGGGRVDIWAPEEDVYWGAEKAWLATSDQPDSRYRGDRELDNPLAAVQMGLIYVNPEGTRRPPRSGGLGRDVRETFARMAMDDEETVALVAGGHTFGKAHGAGDPALVGPEPEAAPIEAMGLGWINRLAAATGRRHHHQRHRRRLETPPDHLGHGLPQTLFKYEWELVKSPAGAHQWRAKNVAPEDMIPDAHDPTKSHRR